jgi:hypothetical protein
MTARGTGYENLPVQRMASVTAGVLASVTQAIAIVRRSTRQQLGTIRRQARKQLNIEKAADDAHALGIDAVLRVIERVDAHLADTHLVVQGHPWHDVDPTDAVALDALRAGHACLVQYESRCFTRWALLTGIELERCSGRSRALLLLDASASEPWAAGHNVRIELHNVAGAPMRASESFTLNCRHLTGEAHAVRLSYLVVLSAGRPAPKGAS